MSITNHERWYDINAISRLLDYCDFLARAEGAIPSNEQHIQSFHQGTIIHLLCVGIDAWASGKWLDFGAWLTNKKGKEEYGRDQRDELLSALARDIQTTSEANVQNALKLGLAEIYKTYNENFGKWRKFQQFVLDLPEPLRQVLMEHYSIGNELGSDIKGLWNTRATTDNLNLIAKYLWDWRRSRFTHEAKAEGAIEPGWFSIFGETHEAMDSGEINRQASWIVSSSIPEELLVRSMLMSSIRQALFNDVTLSYVKTHLRTLIRRYFNQEASAEFISKIGDEN